MLAKEAEKNADEKPTTIYSTKALRETYYISRIIHYSVLQYKIPVSFNV
jgi:hypothetical protein